MDNAAIKYMRIEAGFSQRQVADMVGIDNSLVSLYEAGKRRLSPDKVEALINAIKAAKKDEKLNPRWSSPTPQEIKELREKNNLSKLEAGMMIHGTGATWEEYEAGKFKMPSYRWHLFTLLVEKAQ